MEIQSPEQTEKGSNHFEELLAKARRWHEGENTHKIKILEKTLVDHFQAHWKDSDLPYINEILEWRGEDDDEVVTLSVIESDEISHRSFIVDTDDLILGKKEDEFFFHRIGKCWALVFDVQPVTGASMRIAYHLPGPKTKDNQALSEMIKGISTVGNITQLVVAFNSHFNTASPLAAIRSSLPENTKTIQLDMNQLDASPSHDLHVTENTASQFYNKGRWDLPPSQKVTMVERHHSGDWQI